MTILASMCSHSCSLASLGHHSLVFCFSYLDVISISEFFLKKVDINFIKIVSKLKLKKCPYSLIFVPKV